MAQCRDDSTDVGPTLGQPTLLCGWIFPSLLEWANCTLKEMPYRSCYFIVMPHIGGLWCKKQVSQAGISNCIPQFTVGCNYLFLPEIPASGAKVLIYYTRYITDPSLQMADCPLKLVVVGDGGVGKSSMLFTYYTGSFDSEHVPTLFNNAVVHLVVDGKQASIAFWDTAAQVNWLISPWTKWPPVWQTTISNAFFLN